MSSVEDGAVQNKDRLPSVSDRAAAGAARPAAALLGYMVATALFYLPVLLGIRTFPDGDFTHHFLPFSLLQQRELLSGRLPLWDAYTYSGHPFLADVQAAVFYPVSNLLLGLTLPLQKAGARLYVLQMEAILQVALAGFFAYLLLRRLTGNGWAAWTGGAVFAFSGYLTGYPPVQLAILRTAIWLPLILWLLLRAFERPGALGRWLGVGIALAVAFLAGHPQTFLFLSYTTGGWIVLLYLLCIRTRRWWTPLPGLLLALMAALGLGAVQLLPSLEFTRLSVRADVSYAYVSGGLPLRDTWQLLLPGVLTHYSPLFIGAVGLGLAAVALAALFVPGASFFPPRAPASANGLGASVRPGSEQATWPTFFFAGLALVALLLAYGGNGFLYPIFYRFAPGWDLFRGQERAAYLVAFGLSMLAGLGAAALPGLSTMVRKRTALIFGTAITAWVYGFGLLVQLGEGTAVGQWRYLAIAAITLLLGIGYALAIWVEGWSNRRAVLISLLALTGLFWANAGTNAAPFGPARKTIPAPEMAALGAAVTETSGTNLGLDGRVYNEFRLYEDYGIRQEIEDVWGSSPLRLDRYAMLFDDFPLDRMWDLTGVEHVLTWRRELFEPSTLLAEFPQAEDTTYLHRLTDPNPRARLVTDVRAVDDAEAAALLADHTVDLATTGVVAPEQAALASTVRGTADDTPAHIRLVRLAPNHLRVEVTSTGGLLVLSENWLPGWRIDSGTPGALAAPVRANLAFVGVAVPAGTQRFELIYQPDSVRVGLGISLLALLVVLIWSVGEFVLRRRSVSP